MNDSEETICDDVEDSITLSQSQMSPSIIAPIPRREDVLDQKALAESKITSDVHGFPEFLPPSAKIQRLAKEKPSLEEESAKSRVYDELQSEQATTANMEKEPAEKLTIIREQEEKIEQLLVLLESNVKRGMAPRENPIFAQIKHLMTTVKTQLADFTRYQQQQRQEIAHSSNGVEGSQDGSSSQWTSETRRKLLELATQQKELLKLLQCHKKLLEKIQALKQKAKSLTQHIIPAVEAHCKSHRGVNVQQEIIDKNTRPSLPMTLSASNMIPSAIVTCAKLTPNSASKHGDEQTVNKHTSISLKNVPSSYTQNRYRPVPSHPLAVSQVATLGHQVQSHAASISHTPATVSHNVSSATQISATASATPQSRVQNVVLTGGQLYQVGEKQVYMLPQGCITSVTSSFAVTQATQPQQVTTAKLSSNTTTAVTKKATVTKERALIPDLSVAKYTQGTLLPTVSSGQDPQTFSQLSSNNTPVSSSCVTLPLSLSNSSLPVSTARSFRNSALQNPQSLSNATQIDNQGSNQATHSSHNASISHATIDNTSTVPQWQKRAGVQSQHTAASSQNTAGVQSSLQAAKTTATVASKGPAVQSRSSQSLQRRSSFGSDLPDVKSLLSHSVIEAGSNVLSIQFEGRSFEASLRANGLIESAGGETFRTPMAWMRAVTGSWNTVKQSLAYKMVHYKGRPLALFTIPTTEKETCQSGGKQNGSNATNTAQDTAGSSELPCNCVQDKTSKKSGLITCWDDMAQLLTDCKVIPIGKNELIPTDSFSPANFWDSTTEVDIPQSLLEELDF